MAPLPWARIWPANTKHSVAGGGQLLSSGAQRGLVDFGDNDRGPRFGERPDSGQADAEAAARHECYLSGEVVCRVPDCDSPWSDLRFEGFPDGDRSWVISRVRG